jgi:tetrapyrrole methylase family protein/MazG family protein
MELKDIENTGNAFKDLLEVIIKLRSPEGCPWDKKQTLKSLIPNLFEETFECIDAIDNQDTDNIMEEIGDLYLLVVMLSYIFEQKSTYSIVDILNTIKEKLIRSKKNSILDSIPLSTPPLERSYKIQKKVSKVGFDWSNPSDVLKKIKEELGELEHELLSGNKKLAEAEMGDFLFSVINLSRFLDIDPGLALHKTNQKFTKRFKYVEKEVLKKGEKLEETPLDEMDKYWEQAKNNENN